MIATHDKRSELRTPGVSSNRVCIHTLLKRHDVTNLPEVPDCFIKPPFSPNISSDTAHIRDSTAVDMHQTGTSSLGWSDWDTLDAVDEGLLASGLGGVSFQRSKALGYSVGCSLEELHDVAGRVFHQDLTTAPAFDQVTSK